MRTSRATIGSWSVGILENAENWLFELKWDGFRAIAETNRDGKVSSYSGKQNDFNKRFPVIAEAVN